MRLLRELFIVAVRRSFVGRDTRDVTRYVNDLLAYQSLPTGGEVARQAEALIRGAMGEPELAQGVPDIRRFELICHVIGDLARPPGAAGNELVALVDQAERRVAPVGPPRNPTTRRRGGRARTRRPPPIPGPPATPPESRGRSRGNSAGAGAAP